MKRRHELIQSTAMGRRMNVWCFGHFGQPLLVFPSAAGFAHEWDVQGMVEILEPLIDAGRLKLYCPESNVSQAWTNKTEPLPIRMKAHLAYERFILDDMVPAIRRDCNSESIRIATSGCSLGAMYAANFTLKNPEIFNYALCLSGRYKATHFTGGQTSLEVYYNDPIAYVSNMKGETLERVQRHTFLSMVCGQGPWEEGCIEETQLLCDIFEAKGIPHTRDIWGRDSAHQWDWWHRQAWYHLANRFGR